MQISGKTRVIGVWGYPVTHSLSPLMHNAALSKLGLNWIYVPFSVEPGKIESAVSSVRALDLIGVNVTVPLKEAVASLVDRVDSAAARIKSVNTIVNKSGELVGYSTDGQGLLWDLRDKAALPQRGSSVLVLGAGGSARAVVDSLHIAGLRVFAANRTRERVERLAADLDSPLEIVDWSHSELTKCAESTQLIINTTTLGMTNSGAANTLPPLADGCIGQGQVLYDLVYSPPITPLMQRAKDSGASVFNGIGMLVRQGAVSLHLWSGLELEKMPISEMEMTIQRYLSENRSE